jgi:hypothetical protein
LNRVERKPAAAGRRTRGDLPILAAAHGAAGLEALNPAIYDPFNLLLLESMITTWWRWDGESLTKNVVEPGVHFISSRDMDDETDSRRDEILKSCALVSVLPHWADSDSPNDPVCAGWQNLTSALAIVDSDVPGYGTISGSLVAIGSTVVFDFCKWPPDIHPWSRISERFSDYQTAIF